MNIFKNYQWWNAAITRAVKTVCQTVIAMIGTTCAGVMDVEWVAVLSAAALAGLLSLLTSIAGLPEVDESEVE